MTTNAKLRVTTEFLDHLRLPPGFLIVEEQHFEIGKVDLIIRGPFPSTIPDNGRVMANITKYAKPRNYIEWQWYHQGVPHGNPIEMAP